MCFVLVHNGPNSIPCIVYVSFALIRNYKVGNEVDALFLKGLQEGPPQLFVTNGTQLHPRRASELNLWTEGHRKYFFVFIDVKMDPYVSQDSWMNLL